MWDHHAVHIAELDLGGVDIFSLEDLLVHALSGLLSSVEATKADLLLNGAAIGETLGAGGNLVEGEADLVIVLLDPDAVLGL